MDDNFFDMLGIAGDESKEQKHHQRIDELIHNIFAVSPDGKELFDIWQNALLMQPTAVSGMDSIGIGIEEGKKTFIRGILATIRKVENE